MTQTTVVGHTPGPWKVSPLENLPGREVPYNYQRCPSGSWAYDGYRREVRFPGVSRDRDEAGRSWGIKITGETRAQVMADASLVGTAPEMLASLIEIEAALRWHFIPLVEDYAKAPEAAHAKDDAIQRLRAVIAKATGQ
jgi:hypothetical protein